MNPVRNARYRAVYTHARYARSAERAADGLRLSRAREERESSQYG